MVFKLESNFWLGSEKLGWFLLPYSSSDAKIPCIKGVRKKWPSPKVSNMGTLYLQPPFHLLPLEIAKGYNEQRTSPGKKKAYC